MQFGAKKATLFDITASNANVHHALPQFTFKVRNSNKRVKPLLQIFFSFLSLKVSETPVACSAVHEAPAFQSPPAGGVLRLENSDTLQQVKDGRKHGVTH